MDIREFSYILAIVEHGSFTKAANALYISQPSLSLYIKNIESEQKINFDRRGAGICGLCPEDHGT